MLNGQVIQTADSGYGESEDGQRNPSSSHSSIMSGTNSIRSSNYEDDIDDSPDNVSVIVRVRPLNHKELARNEIFGLQFGGEGRVMVDSYQSGTKPKMFTFNVVFEPAAIQSDIFEHSGVKQLIDMALDGFSSTVFAYGQTGSGKTYTLTGPPLKKGKMVDNIDTEGLMCRSFRYLFAQLAAKQDTTCVIHASFLEIYNEQVVDLLNPGAKRKYLQVRWSRGKGFYVENLFVVECVELDDVMAVMEEGLRNRQVAPNNVNEYSSRSHCILTLSIATEIRISEEENAYITKQGKLIFVDLAGSEKVSEKGTDLNETNKINRSLLTLGKCISALGERKKGNHIPYRDSKLTKLLADSLGGNGVTLMIACVSPAKSNLSETINTLRYAARTKRIKNKPIIVMDPRETMILGLQREVKLLRAENQYLRKQLEFPKKTESKLTAVIKSSSLENLAKLKAAAENNSSLPPEVNPKELYDMLQEYMIENEALREENADLLRARDVLLHDQELISRENERLARKLEDKDRNGRSPLSIGRTPSNDRLSESISSASSLNSSTTNIWVNNRQDMDATLTNGSLGKAKSADLKSTQSPMPETISKELQRRKIGTNITEMSKSNSGKKSHARHNSWDSHMSVQRDPPPNSRGRKPNPVAAVKTNVSPGSNRMRNSKSEQSLRNLKDETAATRASKNNHGSPANKQPPSKQPNKQTRRR